ncbi:MAG: hypothetical protein JWO46_3061 [Nocardioidaceae bacterium]|nr:hypothetical protein [Nocardioidaceae bacterium]
MTSLVRPAPRSRALAIVGLLVLAPVCAELLSAYLAVAGDPGATAFLVLFLAPLYGGAALLIREAAVRTGRGWPGVVLLAAAFGVAMTALVDLSLWTTDRTDVDGWSEIVGAARVAGVSLFALTSWVGGHIALSIGAPLLLVEAGVPEARGRPLLGRVRLAMVVLAGAAVAVAVHVDPERSGVLHTSPGRYATSGAVVLALVALAFSPLGRARSVVPGRRAVAPGRLLLAGVLLTALLDLAPPGRVGVVVIALAGVAAVVVVGRQTRAEGWTPRHGVAFALGIVLERTAVGALAPPAPGVAAYAVVVQAGVFAALLLGLGRWVWRRSGTVPT